jgi:hypothetical protein
MTDQTTITQEAPTGDEDGDGGAYDLALFMKQRCAGFAYLLKNTSEHVGFIETKDVDGIARLAEDISEKADELYECVRAEGQEAAKTKKGE